MAKPLTQKEQFLLQDQKKHEELCVQKYQNYAQQAQDPQLKQLFNSLAQQEQQHLSSVNQILSGQVPTMQQNQAQNQQSQQQQQQQQQPQQPELQNQMFEFGQMQGVMSNKQDADLCTDMLVTEKYISSSYDNTIFECTDSNVRQVLNHIQKEEQQHGEKIFNYMKNNGMYNPQ